MTRKIAVFGVGGAEHADIVRAALAPFPDFEVGVWACDGDEAARDKLLADCEVGVISPDFVLTPGNFAALIAAPKLKMMVQPWVGVDWIDTSFLPKDLLVCNAGGHAAPMAEHVIGVLLEHVLELRSQHNDMLHGRWHRAGRNNAPNSRHGDIGGKTLALVGYGEIGQAIAARAAAFNMRVIAIAGRKRDTTPAPLDWIGLPQDLHKLLGQADFLVLACDLNEQTEAMIDTKAFAAMQSHCYLVNVARGEVVEEDALYHALKTKQIGGAALDTWYRYPTNTTDAEPDPDTGGAYCGSRHNFLELDNVLLTPHSSAHSVGADEGRYISIAETLKQYAAGEKITRHVLTGTGGNLDGFKMP